MISERKREANRRNAQKSTGPKTEEGKSKVKLNAVGTGSTPGPSSCRTRMRRPISKDSTTGSPR